MVERFNALLEFDPPTNDRLILLADHQVGAAFPAAGPLKIIALGDETHARWVCQVKSLALVRAPKSGSDVKWPESTREVAVVNLPADFNQHQAGQPSIFPF